jgi:1-acyl-sn-glycerol-3-phosphate acyltransferase
MSARAADPRGRHTQLPRTDEVPALRTALLPRAARVARVYFSRRYDVRLSGGEHVPTSGPVLFTANHLGILDGPLLVAYAPRLVHGVVKREIFAGRVGQVLFRLGQIPIDRETVDIRAVKQMLRALRDDGVVAIYPEGVRGAGDVAHSRLGAAYLALCSGAPVVPVACLGTRLPGASVSAMPPRGSRVHVVYGAPYHIDQVPWPRRKAEVASVAETLRAHLAAHVQAACAATGESLPGPAPDEVKDIAGRHGPEVGPQAAEVAG